MDRLSSEGKVNHYKLIWSSGELEGLFVDFSFQEIGYKDYPTERLEYRKIQVLRFLMEQSPEYINGPYLNLIEEYNSVDLPKTISIIKSAIIKVLTPVYGRARSAELYDTIILKRKVNGSMGYRLSLKDTVLSTDSI